MYFLRVSFFSNIISFKHVIYLKHVQKFMNCKVFKTDRIAAVNPDIVNNIVSIKINRFVPFKMFFSVDFI
jgi:hypothetical protein